MYHPLRGHGPPVRAGADPDVDPDLERVLNRLDCAGDPGGRGDVGVPPGGATGEAAMVTEANPADRYARLAELPGVVYHDESVTLIHADYREVAPYLPVADVVIADPPYGETSLQWDRWPDGWLSMLRERSLWCFGSLRMFMSRRTEFDGWRHAQDVVWEKHNGSSFHADRFKRVHELAVHFYRGPWGDVYHEAVTVNEATPRTVRRKHRPPHTGHIEASSYESHDGGPKLMRSVIFARSCHGYAIHPTQKPLEIVEPLISYSCPTGGLVLDPFCGSGTTLLAAKRLGRRAVGVEAREDYCEAAVARLSQGVLGLEAS